MILYKYDYILSEYYSECIGGFNVIVNFSGGFALLSKLNQHILEMLSIILTSNYHRTDKKYHHRPVVVVHDM